MKLLNCYSVVKDLIKLLSSLSAVLLVLFVTGCYYERPAEPSNSRSKPYQQNPVPLPRADGYYYNPAVPSQPYPNSGYGGGYQYPPASRYYNNPYSIPPQNSYPYADQDQYYRPPSAYGSEEIPSATYERY